MRTLAELIDGLEDSPYHFSGLYWAGQGFATYPLPLSIVCHFAYDSVAVIVEGECMFHVGNAKHAFMIRFPFADQSSSAASLEITTSALGMITGKIAFGTDAAEAIGRNDNGAISAHLQITKDNIFLLNGAVLQGDACFGYSVKGGSASSREILSNVVGIFGGKRA